MICCAHDGVHWEDTFPLFHSFTGCPQCAAKGKAEFEGRNGRGEWAALNQYRKREKNPVTWGGFKSRPRTALH